MNENMQQREHVSALMDGALESDDLAIAMDFVQQPEGREAWHVYHLVGDVLRSPELAAGADSQAFLSRLQQRLAAEPLPALPVTLDLQNVAEAPVPAANASVFRWKMAAGFASLAMVAAVGWNSWGSLQGSGSGAAQLAVAAPPATAEVQVAADQSAPAVMIRDPRLDELLAAHRQFGNTSALQMPAGFLRNATFDAPPR